MSDATEIQSRLQHIDELLQHMEHADPATQARLQEIVSDLLEIHRAALDRILYHMEKADGAGHNVINACAADPLVSPVLVLHDLHPLDELTRIKSALEKARPFMGSHGGNVELLSYADGILRLQLQGNCHSCPSSRATLESLLEKEIFTAAPEVLSIEVEGLNEEPHEPAPKNFIPLAINGAVAKAS